VSCHISPSRENLRVLNPDFRDRAVGRVRDLADVAELEQIGDSEP
jgi:hypothetical protein